jgi:3-dehydroquinate synthase class II
LLENCLKYIDEELEILGDSLVAQILKVVADCKVNQKVTPSLSVCFRLFNMFLGTVYLEVDHEDWKISHLENLIALAHQFYRLGFVCSKASLKFLYHLLCREQS